tara:strand:- start:2939 stop:3358 length:420 start_codon:yes stop_codon:yes gene_type:complete
MSIPEAPKDKRTKAYKEWKAKYDSAPKGLGDTIEKITTATGIKKAVKFLAGEDCGCNERKEILNKKFRYNKPECFTEDEYNFVGHIVDSGINTLSVEQNRRMVQIYNRVFNDNRKPSGCSSCFLNSVFKPLKTLYATYK